MHFAQRPLRPKLAAVALSLVVLHAAPLGETQMASATTAAQGCAEQTLEILSENQRIGQLFLFGIPTAALSDKDATAIRRNHYGSVWYATGSTASVAAIASLSHSIQALRDDATGSVRFFIGTDQEGGYVQRLKGPGFEIMPTALDQGQLDRSVLRGKAERWGSQLQAAGVNMNFAPVMDVVPKGFSKQNLPIGYWQREFGYTSTRVANHGVAFLRGMRDAGVAPTLKHFPGLGRVTANTDYTRRVVDSVTTADDPYLESFLAGIDARAPFVMASEAIYTRIDPDHRAVFSHRIITGLLRERFGFDGVVMSDSLGAASVQGWTPAERAIKFLRAGGDLLLVRGRSDAHAMVLAIRERVAAHPTFKAKVDDSVLRVLTAKAEYGLISC